MKRLNRAEDGGSTSTTSGGMSLRDAGSRQFSLYHSVQDAAHSAYRVYVLELLLRQVPLPPSKDGRHIPLQPAHDTPLIDERTGRHYVSNSIRTSRYTLYDFVPKQIVFQATRLSNFYFIVIGVPQTIPGFSTTGNYTTILPLVFFMLLTIVKEGYDDLRRHRLDKVENKSFATVLRDENVEIRAHSFSWLLPWNLVSHLTRLASKRAEVPQEFEDERDGSLHWANTRWKDIRVGDVIRLKRDDPVPADVLLLHADGEESIAYIETMALDGETSLKSKQAPPILRACSDIVGIRSCPASVVVEDPNLDLYRFDGRVSLHGETIPLTLNEVIYRGSVLRNTGHAIGLVINTGEECKIRMNANHHPKAKKPRLERYANHIVLTLIVYVILISVGCSIGYLIWQMTTERKSWYISDASVPFKQIIIGYAIMYNNVIPLAMYVSLEIVKLAQMVLIGSDVEMFDEETNTPMRCNTNTILENLGQIGFVLSDKTGTLTDNVMKFRGMSIGGLVWTHGHDSEEDEEDLRSDETDINTRRETGEKMAVGKGSGKEKASVQVTELLSPASTHSPRPSFQRRTSSRFKHRDESGMDTADMSNYIRSHPHSAFAQRAREFLLGMALCHTCLPETNEHGLVDFQASSPDELALVRAARDLGYLVIRRSTSSITLLVTSPSGSETEVKYEILDVIEFNSRRKRMSVVLRCPDGRIWLLCKGADNVIVPRLRQAGLASRKSRDVKRSAEVDREARKRSLHAERHSMMAERPSMVIERIRRSVDARRSADARPSIEMSTIRGTARKHSPDLPPSFRRSGGVSLITAHVDKFGHAGDGEMFARCFRHLDEFATEGLRTLMFAHRYLSQADYAAWKKLYLAASTSLADREERIDAAGELIEQSLDLLGASAIEDKLQKGVPETIDKLRRANIRVWMLTGDKRETAVNIAHSARICRPESDVVVLDSSKGDLEGQLRAAVDDAMPGSVHSVAVIDGHTLALVEESPALTRLFYSMIPRVDSVICCRASPAQKASIVKAISLNVPRALTLAIGDGANDIAMIQSAHVGVGISGKEGLQAARVADYSIAQFRFLQRLLLVHGRWSYIRTAKFVLWTFWKEMFFYMMQALYQRYNGYSGSSLYENWSLTALNTLFTSLCVILPGILEQDLRAETLLAVPELYVYGQRNRELNLPGYLMWMVGATVNGFIVWFLPWKLYGDGSAMSDNGAFALGDMMFSLAIVWTNWKLLILETHNKTAIIGAGFGITVAGWWVWNAFLAGVYSDNISPFDVKGGFFRTFGDDPAWWATLVVTVAALAALELVVKAVRRVLVVNGRWPPWKRAAEVRAQERELEAWQELEKDPGFLRRLEDLEGDCGDDGELHNDRVNSR